MAITNTRAKVIMAAGRRSLDKKRFYAETARILSASDDLEHFPCKCASSQAHVC
jgi:hypothetical protein